ncbi:right-handed parallel beta-helix repeat-containing protein [Variovorax dokdonensis]|uniref:Right-handed parallel beta-helix repeat-containing protein n=1 Tax=Variovorax dokdonensis TaxID=344883 RepID=A0ABT7N8C1_9BURK|nr:right-handed parallel beta-helix repeat-containing protein [Variovorax dokdonensis]MDM0044172.1 right-handed parallel beta-helix repeat-containing protein [Variovorax dokdonensis]
MKKLYAAAACALLLTALSPAQSKEWRVGKGTSYSLADIQYSLKAQIKPGDVILITPGTYGAEPTLGYNSLAINGFQGTASKPITIKAASSTAMPRLIEGISVFNSKYIVIQHLDVTRNNRDTAAAAIAVSDGSSYVKLYNLSVHSAFVGVSFADPGPGNSIQYSHIVANDHHGIASKISDDKKAANKPINAGDASTIENNLVEGNGGHGIDMEASYWQILRNQVLNNGQAYGGTSGIHLFRVNDRPDDDPDCDNNEILYNYVAGQKDETLSDGNGIQIDHYCDGNLVAYNVLKNNAGAGISLFVGKNNVISSNTLYHNATDKNRVPYGAHRAEMILASQPSICPNDVNGTCILPYAQISPNRSSWNFIYDNIVATSDSDTNGIYVTDDFKDPQRNTNFLYVNWYSIQGNGAPLRWGNELVRDVDAKTTTGNLVAPVRFVNSAATDGTGFSLAAAPPNGNPGWAPVPPRADMAGKFPLPVGTGLTSYWGAFYLCSNSVCASN